MGTGEKLDKNCILHIDDDEFNREIMKHIFSSKYEFIEAVDGLEGLKKVEENFNKISAILLDVSMPVMNGMEFLRIIHSRGITAQIPVFLVTVSTEFDIIKEGYELGAMDVITKPVQPFVILRRVENIIELFRTRENLRETVEGQAKKLKENVDAMDSLHRNTIEALASAIEFRDVESGEHTSRIYSITKYILTNTEFGEGLTDEQIEDMAVASIMHDVGKIAISDVILNKPGILTSEEFEIMKSHSEKGAKLIEQISKIQNHESYKYAYAIARNHHERWDGCGYPDGLKGNEIPLCAQVVSIADVYDALRSHRIYKKACNPDKALQMIIDGECGCFNPKLLECFKQVEPEIRKWYDPKNKYWMEKGKFTDKTSVVSDKVYEDNKKTTLNREVLDVLLLKTAVQSVYDMIICVNLTKNTYYMIDYDKFLTHKAGYYGVFDDLISAGASAVPESHRKEFVNAFSRESLLETYRQGKKSVYLEHPQYADDGEEHMVATTVLFVEDPMTEDILEITLSCYIDEEWEEREIAKQKLKDALIVAEKADKEKNNFILRIGNNIRMPLMQIVDMAADGDNDFTYIEKTSRYLLEHINNLLYLFEIEDGKVSVRNEKFSVRDLATSLKSLIENKANDKKQCLEVFVGMDVEQIYEGDEKLLRRIMYNLLYNAYEYTQEGGKYSLSIDVQKSTDKYDYLRIVVEDNGPGMREECMEKIFNPLSHSDDASGNIGVGLAITRRLVYLMDGTMEVDSQLDKGTKFIINIPVDKI